MTPKVIAIREQEENQRIVLPNEFLSFAAGDGTRVVISRDESSPRILDARIVEEAGSPILYCTTSYFIGLNWIIPEKLAVFIQPKMDTGAVGHQDSVEIDYLAMIKEALTNDELRIEDLAGLQEIKSEEKPIPIKSKDSGLVIFVILQFLTLIDKIRRRGLRRNFYSTQETFRYAMKGRILLSKSLRDARTASATDHLTCSVQQFDIDTPENQYLKRALRKTLVILQKPAYLSETLLIEKARLGLRAFEAVHDVYNAPAIRLKKINPLFRDYVEALRLAEKIISMDSLGFKNTEGVTHLAPYWIDMSKLFEIYVLQRLREAVGTNGTVQYQFSAHYQVLDYLCCAPECPTNLQFFVADAKYKKYDERSLEKEDLRQVAGYARLERVIETLENWGQSKTDVDRVIPCLVLYPVASKGVTDKEKVSLNKAISIKGWKDIYKLGVSLPTKKSIPQTPSITGS